jgi:hypothetical protein
MNARQKKITVRFVDAAAGGHCFKVAVRRHPGLSTADFKGGMTLICVLPQNGNGNGRSQPVPGR